jgi:CHASE2 domain-containing sensor protein
VELAIARRGSCHSVGAACQLGPRVIGVDLYRNRPEPPGTEQLAAVIARHKEIVWAFMLPDGMRPGIPPPEMLRGTDRIAFTTLSGSRSLPRRCKGKNRPDLYFAFGFVVANRWIVQNLSINGDSGGFGYNLDNGVTIVVGATKSETATTEASAFDILREVVKYVTPASPISF